MNTATLTSPQPTCYSELSHKTTMKPPLARIFSVVEHSNLHFLILDCPTEANLHHYLKVYSFIFYFMFKELTARGVTDVVRVCEPTYDKNIVAQNGIKVHDWPFKDGGIPPASTLQNFLTLCNERFGSWNSHSPCSDNNKSPVIAVHCVAGLGRAPVLVAVALIESGMTPLDAVEYVRKRRRGAFNTVQLQYLVDNYKRRNSGSWKNMGEAAKAFFGKRASPPPMMSRSESASSDMTSSTFQDTIRESISKVFRKKSSSPTTEYRNHGNGNLSN